MVLIIINNAIRIFITFSLIDNEKKPPSGTPMIHPKEKGTIIFHLTLNLKKTNLLRFDPN